MVYVADFTLHTPDCGFTRLQRTTRPVTRAPRAFGLPFAAHHTFVSACRGCTLDYVARARDYALRWTPVTRLVWTFATRGCRILRLPRAVALRVTQLVRFVPAVAGLVCGYYADAFGSAFGLGYSCFTPVGCTHYAFVALIYVYGCGFAHWLLPTPHVYARSCVYARTQLVGLRVYTHYADTTRARLRYTHVPRSVTFCRFGLRARLLRLPVCRTLRSFTPLRTHVLRSHTRVYVWVPVWLLVTLSLRTLPRVYVVAVAAHCACCQHTTAHHIPTLVCYTRLPFTAVTRTYTRFTGLRCCCHTRLQFCGATHPRLLLCRHVLRLRFSWLVGCRLLPRLVVTVPVRF